MFLGTFKAVPEVEVACETGQRQNTAAESLKRGETKTAGVNQTENTVVALTVLGEQFLWHWLWVQRLSHITRTI